MPFTLPAVANKAATLFLLLLLVADCVQAQTITTIAGDGTRGCGGDSGQATIAQLDHPSAVTCDAFGNIYFTDAVKDNIRKIDANGIITTIVGDSYKEGTPRMAREFAFGAIREGVAATAEPAWTPCGLVVDHTGNLYYSETQNGTIRKVTPDGIVTTIAGHPQLFTNSDMSLAKNTQLYAPAGLAIDKHDNIYLAAQLASKIYRISASGVVSVVAGNGYNGFSGDGGAATNAMLNVPRYVAVDNAGNIYITDTENGRIRKVDTQGIITTIAGNGYVGYDGDGGPATNATFNEPHGIAVDHQGNVYVTDARNDAVRHIGTDGIITTFAGNGVQLFHGDDGIRSSVIYARKMGKSGDGGPANKAQLYYPISVAVDSADNVYIGDYHHHVIRKVTMPRAVVKEVVRDVAPPLPKAPLNIDANNIAVSTNPQTNLLTITIDNGAYTAFTITDKQNKEWISGALNGSHTDVDVSMLAAGQYYLHLKGANGTKTVRFDKE